MANLKFVDFSKAFDSLHREKIEQILLAYDLPNETITDIIMIYKTRKQWFAHRLLIKRKSNQSDKIKLDFLQTAWMQYMDVKKRKSQM